MAQEGDKALIEGILQLLAQNKVDYTIFWSRMTTQRRLATTGSSVRDLFLDRQSWDAWLARLFRATCAIGQVANGRFDAKI